MPYRAHIRDPLLIHSLTKNTSQNIHLNSIITAALIALP